MFLAEITWGQIALAIVVTIVSFLLICLVLLQKNRGSGLSGAFGGAGGQSAFGTKTGDVLTWVTVGLTAFFLLLCIAGNWLFVPSAEAVAQENPAAQQPTPPPNPSSTAPGAAPSAQPIRVPVGAAGQKTITPPVERSLPVGPPAPPPAVTPPASAPAGS